MTAPDMRTRRVQVALFCRINLEDKLTLAAELRRRNQERFDGEPIMFPPTPDADPGVPAFSLQSKDGNHTLTVSSRRVDVTSHYEPESAPVILDAIEKERDFIFGLVTTLSGSEQVDGNVNRIGVLLAQVADIEDSYIDGIRGIFLAPGITWGRRRFDVVFLDRMPWDNFDVNRRMRLAISQQSNTKAASLELTMDYSTVPGQTHNVDGPWVVTFLDKLKVMSAKEMEVLNA